MARPRTSTLAAPSDSRVGPSPSPAPGRRARRRARRPARWSGWLFAAPAVAVYAVFVLRPILLTLQYSLYRWDGIGPSTWVGLDNYRKLFTESQLFDSILNAFKLILFFSVIPVTLGLVIASTI